MKKQLKFTLDSEVYQQFNDLAKDLKMSKVSLLRLMMFEFLKNNYHN